MNRKIYICENNIQGIFTAVYDAYAAVIKHLCAHEDIKIIPGEINSYEMFCDYINVESSKEKASKVTKTVCERMGYRTYEGLFYASTCDSDSKATSIYFTIVEGLKLKNGFKILDLWTNPYVVDVLELSRKASHECCRFKEFLEFRELESGILYSNIGPVCDILPLLAPHFENRLPNENFIIHDEIRDKFLIHEKQHKSVVVLGDSFSANREILSTYSDKDKLFCDLFKEFTTTIAIEGRINLKLQQQMMPLRIQKYKVEF